MQGDIAKYAMWLFRDTQPVRENLPDLYDRLCHKNPVQSERLSFGEFEALYQQWRWQQLARIDGFDDPPSLETAPEPLPATVDDIPQIADPAVAADQVSQMLSPDAAPIGDYHVVTEMLIEQLVASVKRYLDDGWTPLGGISRASSNSSASYWAQAMVKRQFN